MSFVSMLETAIALAVASHRGQRDKSGQPYILHPLRVMFAMAPDEVAMTAAVLHDVIEDTPTTRHDLVAAGLPEEVVEAVEALSRRRDETHVDYVRRAAANPVAARVKVADVRDNMDESRLPTPELKRWGRSMRKRYEETLRILAENP